MLIHESSDKPVYVQLAEGIENAILAGAFGEDTQVPSTTEISVTQAMNPATALKGINLLVDEGILYKKRGLGMFVAPGARDMILTKRKQAFYETYVSALVQEARKLSIRREEIIAMIERSYQP